MRDTEHVYRDVPQEQRERLLTFLFFPAAYNAALRGFLDEAA